LLREVGTVKADLFSDRADAVVAAREWRQQIQGVE
jgi:hypothetical protein